MQDIFHQLSELVLGSIPTICLFLILLVAYAFLVRRPLERVLADRHARTGGAMDQAQQAIAAAESKTTEYEQKLRDARAAIFESRQMRLKQASDARDKALVEARSQAQKRVDAARSSVEQTGADARTQIEANTEALSQKILAAILPNRASQRAPNGVPTQQGTTQQGTQA